jgi:RimJ/RimL family protein N-acetyltransferase
VTVTLTEQYREASTRNPVAGDGEMSIHIATIEDAPFMFDWRKDTDPTAAGDDYTKERHMQWMTDMLLDEKRVMLVGCLNGRPVGVMTLCDDNNALDVSITMNTAERGKGYGTRMLVLASETLQMHDLSAEIWRKNMATVKLFRNAGFQPVKDDRKSGMTHWNKPAKPKK